MQASARLKPLEYFTPAEWSNLRSRSNLLGLGMVVHAWAIILAAGALFVLWPNPLTFALSVMLIGARQLGLAILMHEAAHGGLSTSARVNDLVGQWLCAAPVGANLGAYRDYHFQHHKHAQTEHDPDLALSAAFPTTRASLRRKIVRDLTGQTFFKQRRSQFAKALGLDRRRMKGRENLAQSAREAVVPFLIVNALIFAVLTVAGLWWAFFVLWLLPMATWSQLVTRLRNIAEHACLTGGTAPYQVARTTRTNLLERLFIAPYWVAYHGEHHMFMYVPCYRLAIMHRLLEAKGHTQEMDVERGYVRVLKTASAGRPAPIGGTP